MILSMLAVALVFQETHGHTLDADGKQAGHKVPEEAQLEAKKLIGQTAPNFATVDASGSTVSLEALRSKPVVLVFIEKDCPCCRSGKPYYDRIHDTYGDVAQVVGIVVGNQAVAAAWKAKTNPQFLVLADPGGKIASQYKSHSALQTLVISQSGKIERAYAGYSQDMLRDLTRCVAELARVKDRKMQVKPAPLELTNGCPLTK